MIKAELGSLIPWESEVCAVDVALPLEEEDSQKEIFLFAYFESSIGSLDSSDQFQYPWKEDQVADPSDEEDQPKVADPSKVPYQASDWGQASDQAYLLHPLVFFDSYLFHLCSFRLSSQRVISLQLDRDSPQFPTSSDSPWFTGD